MSLQDQIEFAQQLEKKFLDLDKTFLQYDSYEGEFGPDAEMMGEIIESLWRLQQLEK
jgi:hypothetical protein